MELVDGGGAGRRPFRRAPTGAMAIRKGPCAGPVPPGATKG
ncbi:hypothetical protein [Azospirillum endophyticum]